MHCLTGPDDGSVWPWVATPNGHHGGFRLRGWWIEPARRIAERFGLHYRSNIQFRCTATGPC